MSKRKRKDEKWESFVERQIAEAQEQGDFDDLPGFGKPMPDLGEPNDAWWWLRKKAKAENLSITPPAFQLRLEVERALEKVPECKDEEEVLSIVLGLNEKIREVNKSVLWGPPSTTMESPAGNISNNFSV